LNTSNDIENRQTIWIALSELYVDTELEAYHYNYLANLIFESSYSLEEVKRINKNDVFPLLFPNLLSVAGVWEGFDEKWLVETIVKKKRRSNVFKKVCYHAVYFCMKGMFKTDWKKVDQQYQRIQAKEG